jgi:membrane associated rhomboid family serine protease
MYQQQPMTDVVKQLLIINVLLFVVTHFVMPNIHPLLCVYFPTAADFMPVQILTHMFMHHGLGHVFFNMIGLVLFGPMIEMVWGARQFLVYYLVCGLGALLLQWAAYYWEVQNGSLPVEALGFIQLAGASGCLFGVMTAFAYLYPELEVGIMFLPFRMKAKFAIPIFAAIELFQGAGVLRVRTNIAHFAHLGGAITGVLLIFFWYKKSLRR